MKNLSPTTRRPHTGFTIIELLVVIAIIAVIAGLLLGGVSIVKESAKESQAQTVLTNLMGNAGMYETKAGPSSVIPHLDRTPCPGHITSDSIYHWEQPKLRNASGTTGSVVITADYGNVENEENPSYSSGQDNDFYMRQANVYIERFIWAANQVPQIRDNLPALGSAFTDTDNDGFMEVIDPWGNPIAYADSVTHNDDPSCPVEQQDNFLPVHNTPFFASAGKDQKWGLPRKRGEFTSEAAWNAYKDTDDYKFSVDNLYSFDLDRSAAKRGD